MNAVHTVRAQCSVIQHACTFLTAPLTEWNCVTDISVKMNQGDTYHQSSSKVLFFTKVKIISSQH